MSDTRRCQPGLPGKNATQNEKEEQGNPTCMPADPTSLVSRTTSMLTGRRMTVHEGGIVSEDRRALVAPAGVVAFKDPEEVSADNFRTHSRSSANPGFEELPVNPELQGKRILENKLEPSTYLADLWALRSIDKCISRRHRLWRGNIDCSVDHTDLNVGSFGVDPVPLDIKLRDFDLSRVVGTGAPGGPQGTQRTGNIAFMALDLLTSEYWEGKVERLYRHDLEGFVWVVAAYAWLYDENGVAVKSSPVQDWFTSDYDRCREEKRDFLSKWAPIDRKDATKDVFDYAIALLLWLMDKQTTRDKRVLYARATGQPERGENQDAPAAYQEIQKIVEDVCSRADGRTLTPRVVTREVQVSQAHEGDVPDRGRQSTAGAHGGRDDADDARVA